MDTIKHIMRLEIIDENLGGTHWAHCMRRGWTHTNREQIKGGYHSVMIRDFLFLCIGFSGCILLLLLALSCRRIMLHGSVSLLH